MSELTPHTPNDATPSQTRGEQAKERAKETAGKMLDGAARAAGRAAGVARAGAEDGIRSWQERRQARAIAKTERSRDADDFEPQRRTLWDRVLSVFGMDKPPATPEDIFEEFHHPRAGQSVWESNRQDGYRLGRRGQFVSEQIVNRQSHKLFGALSSVHRLAASRLREVEQKKNDPARNLTMFVGVLALFGVFGAALALDYALVSEFWSRSFANEFGEVPAAFQSSVLLKSLQVVFAVFALHLLVSNIGRLGRGIFVIGIGSLAIVMLLGLGLLSADSSVPQGSRLFGIELSPAASEADRDAAVLRDLGIADEGDTADTEEAAQAFPSFLGMDVPFSANDYDSMSTLLYFLTFGSMFLFVSSVAALMLHYGTHLLYELVGNFSPERAESFYRKSWRDKSRTDLAAQALRARMAVTEITDPCKREEMLKTHLSAYASAYMEGLERWRQDQLKQAQKQDEDPGRFVYSPLEAGADDPESLAARLKALDDHVGEYLGRFGDTRNNDLAIRFDRLQELYPSHFGKQPKLPRRADSVADPRATHETRFALFGIPLYSSWSAKNETGEEVAGGRRVLFFSTQRGALPDAADRQRKLGKSVAERRGADIDDDPDDLDLENDRV